MRLNTLFKRFFAAPPEAHVCDLEVHVVEWPFVFAPVYSPKELFHGISGFRFVKGDFGAFRLIPVSTSAPHLFLVAPDLLRKNFEIKRILGLASRLLAGDDLASVNSSRSRPFISDAKPQP